MNIIKSNHDLADTLRRVAKSHPSHKLDDIVDLHTCANIIDNLHVSRTNDVHVPAEDKEDEL